MAGSGANEREIGFSYKDLAVLVVDDSSTVRSLLRSILRDLGCGFVESAEDGRVAWGKLVSSERDFDLVLCDINMPNMNGFEFLDKLRSTPRFETLPVILITAEAREDFVAQAAETDADDYLLKPFSPAELDKRIRNLIELRLNPSPYETALREGRLKLRSGNPEGAVDAFKKALKMHPDRALPYYFLGLAYTELRRFSLAAVCLRKALHYNPRHLKSLRLMCRILEIMRNEDGLYENLKSLVSLSPRNIGRQVQLARMAYVRGETHIAWEALKSAVRMALERDPAVVLSLAQELKHVRDEKARQELEKTLDFIAPRLPQTPEIRLRLGDVYFALGCLTKARDVLKDALSRIDPEEYEKQVQLHRMLAKVYERSGIKRLQKEHDEAAELALWRAKNERKKRQDSREGGSKG